MRNLALRMPNMNDDQVQVGQQQNTDIGAQQKAACLKQSTQQVDIDTFVTIL